MAAVAPVVGAIETTNSVDLTTVFRDLGPNGSTYAGVCSSTYGRRPSANTAQAQAEKSLDARFWRLPVRWNPGGAYISTSAAGAGTTSIEADIALYYSWGHRMVLVIAGQGSDFGTWTAGDATRIAQRLVTLGYDLNRFDFSGPNEPGIDGAVAAADKTLQKILDRNLLIWTELQTVQPGRSIWGPVHFMFARTDLQFHQTGMGAKLEGTNYHHYGMGNTSLTTDQAFASTGNWETEVGQIKADAAARGAGTEVAVDEFNWAYRSQFGTVGADGYIYPGDGLTREARFFRAENTIFIASVMGRILRAGGRGMPYATQNGSLGVTVQNANDGNTANLPEAGGVQRPDSSPMPAYWGIAAWTGGNVPGASANLFSHMNRRFYTVTGGDAETEVYAVDNESGGYNLVVINKRVGASRNVRLQIGGLPGGWVWERFRSRKANPYDPFVKDGAYGLTNGTIDIAMEPCTLSVLVLKQDTTTTATLESPWNGVQVIGTPSPLVPRFLADPTRRIQRMRVMLDPRTVMPPGTTTIPAAVQTQLLAIANGALDSAGAGFPVDVRIEWAVRGGTWPASATADRRPLVSDLTSFFGALDDLLGDHASTWGFSLLERPQSGLLGPTNNDPAMSATNNQSWAAGSDVAAAGWLQSLTQQVVTFLRITKGFQKVIAVPLIWSADSLLSISAVHPAPWIADTSDNTYYETHLFPTGTVNSLVSQTYAQYAAARSGISGGFIDTFYPRVSLTSTVVAPDPLPSPTQLPLPPDPSVVAQLPPSPPVLTSVTVSDGSLQANWTASTFGGTAGLQAYVVTAAPTSTAVTASEVSATTGSSSTQVTVGPLINGIEYAVRVVALSLANVASGSSNLINATPVGGAAPVPPPPVVIVPAPPTAPVPVVSAPIVEAFPPGRNFRPRNFLKRISEVPDGQ